MIYEKIFEALTGVVSPPEGRVAGAAVDALPGVGGVAGGEEGGAGGGGGLLRPGV